VRQSPPFSGLLLLLLQLTHVPTPSHYASGTSTSYGQEEAIERVKLRTRRTSDLETSSTDRAQRTRLLRSTSLARLWFEDRHRGKSISTKGWAQGRISRWRSKRKGPGIAQLDLRPIPLPQVSWARTPTKLQHLARPGGRGKEP